MNIVAVDAMGGDNAPFEIIKGCVDAVNEKKNIKLIVVGKQDIIKEELSKYKYDDSRIEVLNADEVIEADEVPTAAIKTKKNSSMVVGLKLLKEHGASAFVSAGNTGALLTGATIIVKRIKGIERPALGTVIPNDKSYHLIMDVGANVDAKPNYLVQYAKIGSLYMENVLDIKNPRVGLINIGTEEEKGNALVKETYPLLKESGVNFVGNIEARDIPNGDADVLVCDAFVGNIILKYSEGLAGLILKKIKNELLSSIISKIGALMCLGAFKRLKKIMDYSEVGGAPLLGLEALVVKAHGSSDANAIKNAVFQCSKFIEADIVNKIKEKI